MNDIEGTIVYLKVIEWIADNDSHFKENEKPLYDEKNLERIKRFANAPIDYIDERIELNEKVSENYHKIHTSILLAGVTGFFGYLLSNSMINMANATDYIIKQKNMLLFFSVFLLMGFALLLNIKMHILKSTGLLRVIRDSEIEIYYLSKIKEHRERQLKEKLPFRII